MNGKLINKDSSWGLVGPIWCIYIIYIPTGNYLYLEIIIFVSKGPPIITISYNETVQTHSLMFPKINIATIPSFTDNITIASNLSSGYWITPRGVISSVSFSIPLFALIDAGYYSLYTNQTWHGQLKLAAKINIMTSGK